VSAYQRITPALRQSGGVSGHPSKFADLICKKFIRACQAAQLRKHIAVKSFRPKFY